MALRLLLGRRVQATSQLHIKHCPRLSPPVGHFGSRSPLSSSSSSIYSLWTPKSSSIPVPLFDSRCCRPSVYDGAWNDDWIIALAKFAVDQHNHDKSMHLQFVRVVGASYTKVSSLLYYVTLEATVAGRQKIYHAILWMQIFRNLMELLACKPVNDSLSAVGVKRGDVKLHEAVMFYMNQMT